MSREEETKTIHVEAGDLHLCLEQIDNGPIRVISMRHINDESNLVRDFVFAEVLERTAKYLQRRRARCNDYRDVCPDHGYYEGGRCVACIPAPSIGEGDFLRLGGKA